MFILRRISFALCALLICSFPAQSWGQEGGLSREERIVISTDGESKVPVLLEAFTGGLGATMEDVRAVQQVLETDLDFADLFQVVRIPTLTDGDAIPPGQARALIRGMLEISQGELLLRGTLESLPERGVILSRTYRGAPEQYRELAHRYADDIVQFLTGRTGISRTQIVYISDKTGNREVYIVDYDGHNPRAVTKNGSINMSPTWSPGGEEIAFVSYLAGDPDIHAVGPAGGKTRLLVGGPGVQSAPAYSPDGARVAYSNTSGRESEIYICQVNGSGSRRVTNSSGINTSPSWSPDGRRLLHTSDRSGTPQVYVVDAEGGSPQRLTFSGQWNDLAAWSPGGDKVAYAGRTDGLFRISITDPSGLASGRNATFGPGSDEDPSWAPDGRHLVFSSTRGGQKGLYIVDIDTGRVRNLVVGGGNHYAPDWSGVPKR